MAGQHTLTDDSGNPIATIQLTDTLDGIVIEHLASSETITLDAGGVAELAATPHGNEAHSENFASSTDFADNPHGNEDHSSTFAVEGDAQPPTTHGDSAHSVAYAVDGDAQPPTEHGNGAHSEDYVTSAEVEPITEKENVVYAGDHATVNAAIDAADSSDGVVEVRCSAGTHTFDDALGWDGFDLLITGQGEGVTTIQADGQSRLINEFNNHGDSTLEIRDCTLDANDVTGSQRFFNIQGTRDRINLEAVTIENLNIGSPSSHHGCFHITEDLGELVFDDCTFRFDTITGRPQYGAKYRVIHTPGGTTIDYVKIRGCHHQGKLFAHGNPDRQTNNQDYFNGYKIYVARKAHVEGCTFDRWGQYATYIVADASGANVTLSDCTTRKHGSGDQFRVGVNADECTLNVEGCSTTGTGTVDGFKHQGDRGVIVQHEGDYQADATTIDGCTFRDTLTPIDVQGGVVSISNCVLRNVGNDSSQGSRAIFITSQRDPAGHITLDNVTVRNARSSDPDVGSNDPRFMDYAVGLADHSSNDWFGPVHISNCKFVGFTETSPVDDQYAGSTVPTTLANNYARDDDGQTPPSILTSN